MRGAAREAGLARRDGTERREAGAWPPGGAPGRPLAGRLWSLGVFLVAIGVAAHVVGWDALLFVPQVLLDSLAWLPMAAVDAVRASPGTWALVAAGVGLMVVARAMGRR